MWLPYLSRILIWHFNSVPLMKMKQNTSYQIYRCRNGRQFAQIYFFRVERERCSMCESVTESDGLCYANCIYFWAQNNAIRNEIKFDKMTRSIQILIFERIKAANMSIGHGSKNHFLGEPFYQLAFEFWYQMVRLSINYSATYCHAAASPFFSFQICNLIRIKCCTQPKLSQIDFNFN